MIISLKSYKVIIIIMMMHEDDDYNINNYSSSISISISIIRKSNLVKKHEIMLVYTTRLI
jgi:hypothetical protein